MLHIVASSPDGVQARSPCDGGPSFTRDPERPARRIAVIGASLSRTRRSYDGVHDYAVVLAEALEREYASCTLHWLWRDARSLRGARSEFVAWRRRVAAELEQVEPRAALLHYSVFEHSHRGVPLFVRTSLAALRRLSISVILIAHEYAFPWRLGGWRGKVWSLTQRAALVEVVRASTAVIVTTESRAEWFRSRRWLPDRPVAFAPVFSNLPAPALTHLPDRRDFLIGLFAYSHTELIAPMVLDAIGLLRDQGVQVQLTLVGAPGRSSPVAIEWLRAARARGASQHVSFTDVLPAQACSDALASCDVLLFVDPSGPTSRRGSLAASLASGTPVVAIDGPDCWQALKRAAAARVVPPSAPALADALHTLLADESERRGLGSRGQAFAEQEMNVHRTVGPVRELLETAGSAS
jgi:glycosyltransferase involved in cell wall biosynthesis